MLSLGLYGQLSNHARLIGMLGGRIVVASLIGFLGILADSSIEFDLRRLDLNPGAIIAMVSLPNA